MSAQTRYGFKTPVGAAGGIVDLAPYAIDTFLNEEGTGAMKFGTGVVSGTKAGINVKLPVAASTAAKFEGIVVNNRTTEYDMEGNVNIKEGGSVGVMRYGRVYARVHSGAEPEYGKAVYLVTSGNEAGTFIERAAVTNTDEFTTVAVKGRFLGCVDTTGAQIAIVELFNQAQA